MYMRSDVTIVVNANLGIDYATAANEYIGLQHSTSHHLGSLLQHNRVIDPSRGMKQRGETEAHSACVLVHPSAQVTAHDLTDTIHQLDLIRIISLQRIIPAEHLKTSPMVDTLFG